MPSSYTTSLRLTLPATGELSGQWGNTVNTGITELLDSAVAGTASISTWGGAGVAYTLSSTSGAADEARKMFIVASGSPGEAKNVICPAVSKFYVFRNDTTGGFALTLKTPSGTGISVPAGQYKFLYCDGTNVVEMFNSAGALSLSGNLTLSGGTANGVLYLNGSKVVTTGSGLVFDGSNLGLGVTPTSGWEAGVAMQFSSEQSYGKYGYTRGAYYDGSTYRSISTLPAAQLQIAGGGFLFKQAAASTAGAAITLSTSMTLDSSGNLGLGVTPSASWNTAYRAFQLGPQGVIANDSLSDSVVSFGANYYRDSSETFRYIASDVATRYAVAGGAHQWFTAPSGTAGNAISFTQAMTLDADGYLLVGTTTRNTDASVPVQINAGSNQLRAFSVNRENSYGISLGYNNVTGNDWGEVRIVGNKPMVFFTNNTERARITSGGDLLVPSAGSGSTGRISVRKDTGVPLAVSNEGATGTLIEFSGNGSGALGSITHNGTNVAYNTSSDYRLKDNPQPLTNSGAFIDALQPKTWNWKADGSRGVGFIAHEAQAVSPGSVVGEKDAVDADGNPVMQAMEYGSAEFIANIIAELQSLRARVAALEAKP